MKKPRFRKNEKRRQKKLEKNEQKRKEARKAGRLAHLELLKLIKDLPEEEAAKLLGEDMEEEFDDEY